MLRCRRRPIRSVTFTGKTHPGDAIVSQGPYRQSPPWQPPRREVPVGARPPASWPSPTPVMRDVPAGLGGGWGPPPDVRPTNTMAVLALVTGICALAPLGILFGCLALSRIRRTGEPGRGVAVAGIGVSAFWILLLGPIIVIALLGAASGPPGGGAADAGGSRVVASNEIQVGDCVRDDPGISDGGPDIDGVTVVACGRPHHSEVYAAFEIDAARYPGRERLIQQVERSCRREFAAFVGVDYDSSTLDVAYLYPRAQDWARDRGAVCLVHDPRGDVRDSLRGSRR
jgi:hypothetical protein